MKNKLQRFAKECLRNHRRNKFWIEFEERRIEALKYGYDPFGGFNNNF